MAFYDDPVFFNLDDFAVEAQYSHQNGPPSPVRGIFDSEYFNPDRIPGIEVADAKPSFTCKSELVEDAVENDTITISGRTYYIMEVQPDGTGITVLILSKDPA